MKLLKSSRLLLLLCLASLIIVQSSIASEIDSNTASPSNAAPAASEEEDDGSLVKSQSQQYASYSSFGDQNSQEFGMRKTSPFDSQMHSQPSQDFPQQGSQQQSSFDAPSNNVPDGSQGFREFGPSIYNMPSHGDMMNGQNQQNMGEYGQQQNGASPSMMNSDMGSFTPVSLSVEEAFKKYFPSSNKESFSSQGPNQQSMNGGFNGNNQQAPGDEKDVVSIDSLREIVEKEPLARPDPFDPPSPPLSAFLPPPPNAQLVDQPGGPPPQQQQGPNQQYPPVQPSMSPPEQMTMSMNPSESQMNEPPKSQMFMSQGPPQGPQMSPMSSMDQFKSSESDMSRGPSFMGGSQPKSSKFMFSKESDSMNENPDGSFGEENDDEGYAYNTENLDENGKKVFVYSRPVQVPELNSGSKFDTFTSTMSNHQTPVSSNQDQIMAPMYRKPVSYNEDDMKHDQGPPMDHQMNSGPGFMVDPPRPYHNEMNMQRDKSMDNSHVGPMYQMTPPMNDIRPPPSVFPEFNEMNYDHSASSHMSMQSQQQQQTWNNGPNMNQNNMGSMEYNNGNGNNQGPSGPQQIEYGGFIPIKKPMPSINQPEPPMNNNREPYMDSYMPPSGPGPQKAPYDFSPPPPPPPPQPMNNDYGGVVPHQQRPVQPPPPQMNNEYGGVIPHSQRPMQPPPQMHQMPPSQPPMSPAPMSPAPMPPAPMPPAPMPPTPMPQQSEPFKLNLNYESDYQGPSSYNMVPREIYSSNGPAMPPPGNYQQMNMPPQGPPPPNNVPYPKPPEQGPPSPPPQFINMNMNKIQNVHVKPLYGRDAMQKLRELGINEDEFYGTVNKILQKSRGMGKGPGYGEGLRPTLPVYMPKANLYRAPQKNRPRPYQPPNGPMKTPGFFGQHNMIAEDFELKFLKDELPPGASYNPRDVGLDESVLAQIHLLDSGIGGYRYTPGSHQMQPTAQASYYRPLSRKPVPYKKAKESYASSPYAMNSMILPFIFPAPRRPYSQTNTKGYYPVYGYKAAASELKPQFILPKGGKPFKFLSSPQQSPQSVPSTMDTNVINPYQLAAAAAAAQSSSDGSSSSSSNPSSFANIFGIRSIKGIKSLVSYLTGGVSG